MSYTESLYTNLPQNLSRQEMQNPYIVIQDFFCAYHLPQAIRELNKWVRSAFAEKSRLGKKESLSILNLQELIIRLLEAAQLLNDDTNDEKALNIRDIDPAALINPDLYYRPHSTMTAWECFPRHLSYSEYINPYLVFEKCLGQLNLEGWRKFLKDLFYAAAYDTKINEAVNDDDLYYTSKCVFKLIEACHLIKVREIDPNIQQEPISPKPNGPQSSNTMLHAVNN